MTPEELGDCYSTATLRGHNLINNFYESLFDDEGQPIENPEVILETIAQFRYKFNLELDLIKEAVHQYNESHHGRKG